jgi:signal transduction histidine kinase/ActR/RegA family two-component response regulator
MLSRPVQLYVALVCAAAAAAVIASASLLGHGPQGSAGATLVVIALAGLAGSRPVRIESLRTELVASHPLVLCALAHGGPLAGMLSAIAGLSGTALRQGRKPLSLRLAFNLASVVLTTLTASWAFRALGGELGGPLLASFPPLVGATVAYFVVNTGLVTLVISLERDQPPLEVWRSNIQWTAISFFAGLTLAACLLLVLERVGPWGLALGIPPIWLLASFYRTHKDRLEEKHRRLQDVEALNAELESTVLDLQTALEEVESAHAKLQREIHERKHAEQALRASEEQLRQSQKMEAIGRLAGGVAHDFNNLLTVITGYTDLLLTRLDDDGLRESANEVKRAADRAAGLTRQLLAFGRRQVLCLKLLDVNAVVENMDKMLRRVIGEDIELVVSLAAGLGPVKADPGQIEQVLMNLAVNARDAMATGGRLTIETASVDRGTLEAGPSAPGECYVRIRVIDTGCGMDGETLSHIFEPFYTTKAEGKGTGLGLSTVYGIVNQSGGWIAVDSKVGGGTVFSIYLPRAEGAVEVESRSAPMAQARRGWETVLLVEDEDQVRELTREILEQNGYRVFETSNAQGAIEICRGHDGPIHLMLTDVVMPQMNGHDLFDRVASVRPEMKVIFMSGYTDRAVIVEGERSWRADYLPKPFTLDALAGKVRQVLDDPRAASRAGAAPSPSV